MEENDEYLLIVPKSIERRIVDIDQSVTSYTIYCLLRHLDPDRRGFITRTRLNKASYIVNNELKEKHGIDPRLPWFWYKHGPMLGITNAQLEEMDLVTIEETKTGVRLFYGKEPDHIALPKNIQDTIIRVIRSIMYISTDDMVDRAYKDRPFLNQFRNFEKMITNYSKEHIMILDFSSAFKESVMNLERLYPEGDLEDTFRTFLRFNGIMRIVSKTKPDFVKNMPDKVINMRELESINASYIYFNQMTSQWVLHEQEELQRKIKEYNKQLSVVEETVFSKVYQKAKEKDQLSNKLKEISLEIGKGG